MKAALIGAAVVLVVAGGVVWLAKRRRAPVLTSEDPRRRSDPENLTVDPIPLQPFIDQATELLHGLRTGRVTCPQAHPKFRAIHDEVYRLAFGDRCMRRIEHFPGQSQAAYDLFNLAAEMADATRFRNPDTELWQIAETILAKDLGGPMVMRPRWGGIVRRRGPVHFVARRTCARCGHSGLAAGDEGFMMRAYAFCEQCGDLHLARLACEEDRPLVAVLSEFKPETRRELARASGLIDPPCHCGGRLLITGKTCPWCGAAMDSEPLSRFEFFSSHGVHALEPMAATRS